jgi:hypothetical protein
MQSIPGSQGSEQGNVSLGGKAGRSASMIAMLMSQGDADQSVQG